MLPASMIPGEKAGLDVFLSVYKLEEQQRDIIQLTSRKTDKLTENRRLHTKVSTSSFLRALVVHTMKSAKL